MKEIKALRDGGRSLDITAAKRNPTKKTEPIVTKKQPRNCEEELVGEEEEEVEVEGDLIFIDDGAWNLLFSYATQMGVWLGPSTESSPLCVKRSVRNLELEYHFAITCVNSKS